MSRKIEILEKELRKLYLEERMTTYEISKIYDCCQGTVWKRLKKYGIKTRSPSCRNANIPSKKELEKLYCEKRLSTWQIEEKFGYCRGTVHRKLKDYGIRTRTRAESHIIYPRKNFSGNLIEKAYLIGFALGDLRARKCSDNSETISVECGSTRQDQLNLIKSLFQNYGNVWITKPNSRGAKNIGVGLDLSFSFLIKKTFPRWVLDNKCHFFSFLAGFADAEGYIAINNRQALFSIGNYNREILSFINNGLLKFGIKTSGIYEYDITNYVGADGYGHNQRYLRITMTKKSELLKLFNLLMPYVKHESKINALKNARMNIIERNNKFGGNK